MALHHEPPPDAAERPSRFDPTGQWPTPGRSLPPDPATLYGPWTVTTVFHPADDPALDLYRLAVHAKHASNAPLEYDPTRGTPRTVYYGYASPDVARVVAQMQQIEREGGVVALLPLRNAVSGLLEGFSVALERPALPDLDALRLLDGDEVAS